MSYSVEPINTSEYTTIQLPYIKTFSKVLQADTTNKTRDALLVKLASKAFGDDLQNVVNSLHIDTPDINSEVTKYIETKVASLKTVLGNPITKDTPQYAKLIELLTRSATKNPAKTISSTHAHIDKIIEKLKTLNGQSEASNSYKDIKVYDGQIGKTQSNTINAIKSLFSEVEKITNTDPVIIYFDKTNASRPFKLLEKF